ncbi:MAG: xanthine dehydrogenase family protein molybdopterin-binding subunit [Betaproteobacteria bacterium]|nr:xanthine dehydrogenase family protein molybdopterin-binding subunit [Betaproteobacteria bacterium]
MNTEGIGNAVLRKEDRRFLTGRGRFVADIVHAGELHCALVRSPHAHARLRSIDVNRALQAEGVVAVFSGEQMAADGIAAMQSLWCVTGRDGPMAEPPRYALARGVVRHVGEAVAVVIAERREQALDAAERVAVDYEPLDAVVSARSALDPGAPQLHPAAPGNVCLRFIRGDEAKTRAAFDAAAHVIKIDLVNQRIAGCAIEPRAVIAIPQSDGDSLQADSLTLYAATQVPHHVRRLVAEQLGMVEGKIRVISPDVGGGFGYKGKHYPEETIVAWAARRLNRSVKWIASRSESFLSDTQARDHATHAELALDSDGRFLALRVETVANVGAYVSTMGAAIPSAIYSGLLAGVYRTGIISIDITLAFSNTVPTDAYRGAGRPEACFVLERLADQAARELHLDRAEIRRRNLIPQLAMPYATPIGPVYDCGDFPRVFERALALADYAGFEPRRRAAAARGRLRGIGMAIYVESSGVAPSKMAGALGARAGFYESAELRVDASGGLTALLGTHNHGQGHSTTFAQILSSRLGVPLSRIDIVEGDTGRVPYGTGTFGSRSMSVGGSALAQATDKVIAKGRLIAAHLMEVAAKDIEFQPGRGFVVAGTDRVLSFEHIARAGAMAHNLPAGCEPVLHETAFYDPKAFAFSNGAHVCEVDVDPDTGVTRIVGYWVVDDVGTVINPMIVAGQVHGGLAQGIGQALMEGCRYDPESGQLFSATFMDYALPRADQLPDFVSETDESQPCTHNPLGAKGCGESGAIGAPAAVVSALLDALSPLGVRDLEMPATPDRLWRVMEAGRGGR